MKTEIFEDGLARYKDVMGLSSEQEVAESFGTSRQVIWQYRKQTRSLPYWLGLRLFMEAGYNWELMPEGPISLAGLCFDKSIEDEVRYGTFNKLRTISQKEANVIEDAELWRRNIDIMMAKVSYSDRRKAHEILGVSRAMLSCIRAGKRRVGFDRAVYIMNRSDYFGLAGGVGGLVLHCYGEQARRDFLGGLQETLSRNDKLIHTETINPFLYAMAAG